MHIQLTHEDCMSPYQESKSEIKNAKTMLTVLGLGENDGINLE